MPVALGFVALCVVVQAMTIYPDWGRMAGAAADAGEPADDRWNRMPWSCCWTARRWPISADLLPASVRLVGANNNLVQPGGGGLLAQQAAMAIRNHAGPLYGLEDPAESPGVADRTLAYYGLRRGSCAPVQSNLDNNAVHLCRLWPRSSSPMEHSG